MAILAAAAALALTGCGGSDSASAPVQRTASPVLRIARGAPTHIAVVLMENEEYGDIIGSSSTPYINSLAKHYATARSMYAITHPSLPNYLALTGGSTFGIDSDCTDCSVKASSLVDQFEAAGVSWKAYTEDLPHPCFKGAGAGDYAKKHNPFLYYTRVADRPARCARVVPMTQLAVDERAHALPKFVWITPNLCHDMHDCSAATGDRFLAGLLPPLLDALGPRGLLFLTWDEGTTDAGCCRLAAGGHVATVIAGGGARPGAHLKTAVDQYSILQAIEDLLRLSRLRGAACVCTPTLAPVLRGTTKG